MAIGGGLGTVVIALIVLLLGGDPSQVLNSSKEAPATESGPITTTPEEDAMDNLVRVVLAGTEDVWTKIFRESNMTYSSRYWFFSGIRSSLHADMQAAQADRFIVLAIRKFISTLHFLMNLRRDSEPMVILQ